MYPFQFNNQFAALRLQGLALLVGVLLVGFSLPACEEGEELARDRAVPAETTAGSARRGKTNCGPQPAAQVMRRYITAIEQERLDVLENLFDQQVTYDLQFPVRPDGGTTPVVYTGKTAVVDYFRNGFAGFENIRNVDVQIDQSCDPDVAWVRYRQLAEVPGNPRRYENIVVERIQLANGRIRAIVLYESPDLIRAFLSLTPN